MSILSPAPAYQGYQPYDCLKPAGGRPSHRLAPPGGCFPAISITLDEEQQARTIRLLTDGFGASLHGHPVSLTEDVVGCVVKRGYPETEILKATGSNVHRMLKGIL